MCYYDDYYFSFFFTNFSSPRLLLPLYILSQKTEQKLSDRLMNSKNRKKPKQRKIIWEEKQY